MYLLTLLRAVHTVKLKENVQKITKREQREEKQNNLCWFPFQILSKHMFGSGAFGADRL